MANHITAEVAPQEDELKLLGSSYGGLINELYYSPSSTLDPLLEMLGSLKNLAKAGTTDTVASCLVPVACF
jgi:hypothetical protein